MMRQRVISMLETPCLTQTATNTTGCTNTGHTVATASYGIAGEVLSLTYDNFSETRQYNSMFQLTRMTATTGRQAAGILFGAKSNDGCDTLTCWSQNGFIHPNDPVSTRKPYDPKAPKPPKPETPSERLFRCQKQFAEDLQNCADAYPPGPDRQACFAAATASYNRCKGIGVQ